jgi:uroporphyrinogen-III synthase
VTSSADGGRLDGRTVVVTRAAEQASTLSARLRVLGATVVEVPTIEVVDPPDRGAALREAVARLDEYDWVVLTSVNGVRRFVAAGPAAPVRVAAVGPGTADALRVAAIEPALVPDRFVAEGLLEVFPRGPGRVLLAQAHAARPVLAGGLRTKGWTVDAVVAYSTAPARPAEKVVARARRADAITFTSGSTVRGYVDVAGVSAVPPVVVCIGRVTADAATAAGLGVTAVAHEHTLDGLVAALVETLA